MGVRVSVLVFGLCVCLPRQASAEWQIKPFIGFAFGGQTTLVDLEHAARSTKVTFGGNGVLLGEILGVEVDFGHTPRYFETPGQGLVLNSGATTLTGSLVIAAPRRATQYSLRPYLIAGGGLIHRSVDDYFGVTEPNTLPAWDVGGGVTGFLNDRVGLNWDVRYFHSLGGTTDGRGRSFGAEQLSFWRASMALAIRPVKEGSR